MSEKLHVALGFDDYFWAPAYATMRSVAISTKRRADLVFHLLEWGVTSEHRADLDKIRTEFGSEVIHYAIDADPRVAGRIAALPSHRGFPRMIYARLMIDALLPAEVGRLVYLDSDVYVRAPIERLAEIDLLGNAIAAAPEPGRHRLILGDDMRERKSPFDAADPYFNSGVMVIDRTAWAAADLPGQLERLRTSGELKALYHDQDVLNLAFRGKVLILDPLWNLTKPHPLHRAFDPHIVHYTTGLKPWNRLAYVAFGTTYKHVMTRDLLRRYRRYRWAVWLNRLFGRAKP